MLRSATPTKIAPNALVTFTTPVMPMSARSAANHNTAASRRPHRIARKHSPQTRPIHIIVHELGRLDSSVTVTGARPVVDTNNAWRRADGQTQSAEDVIPSITKRPAARRDANILRTRRDALSVASLLRPRRWDPRNRNATRSRCAARRHAHVYLCKSLPWEPHSLMLASEPFDNRVETPQIDTCAELVGRICTPSSASRSNEKYCDPSGTISSSGPRSAAASSADEPG